MEIHFSVEILHCSMLVTVAKKISCCSFCVYWFDNVCEIKSFIYSFLLRGKALLRHPAQSW